MPDEKKTLTDAIASMTPDPDSAAAWAQEADANDPEQMLLEAEGQPAPEGETDAAQPAEGEPEPEEVASDEGVEDELEGEQPGDDTDEEPAPDEAAFKLTLSEGDEEIEVELAGLGEKEQAALRSLQDRAQAAVEMAESYQKVRAQAEQNQRDMLELQAIEDELKSDPVGYLKDRVDEKIARDLVISMLHNDEILQAVEDKLEEWVAEPARRELDAKEAELRRVKLKQSLAEQKDRDVKRHGNAVEVYRVLESMINPEWDAETQRMWLDDAIKDVGSYVSRNQIDTMPPDQVEKVLERRIRQYGAKKPSATPSSRAPGTKQGSDAAKIEEAKANAKRIKTSVTRRRRAAGTPSGASATPGSVTLPKGAKLEDAIAELKKRTRQ